MAKKTDNPKSVRTLRLPVPSRNWERAALALTHEAKNLFNTTNFLIRQIESSYGKDPDTGLHVRKAELHPNQFHVLVEFNRVIASVNAKRRAKAEASEPPKEPKLLPLLEPRMTAAPLTLALDMTVLDNVARGWEDEVGDIVYRRLPAISSQQVVASVIDAWKASLAALRDWAVNPGKYKGRPRMPGFIDPDGHFPLEAPFAMIVKGFPKPKTLPVLAPLGVENIKLQDLFYDHDMRAAVNAACKERGFHAFDPQHVRLVEKDGRIKIEAVVSMAMAFPEGSFLKTLFDEHGDELREYKNDGQRERFILGLIRDAAVGEGGFSIAGIDFGETNIAALAFSTGHRAIVHSGERPYDIVQRYHALLDERKAELATPRQKELQRLKGELKEKNLRLEKPLAIELRRLEGAAFRDPLHRSLQSNLDRIKSDFEHKISTDLVERCVKNGIHVIVVGRNKGMKAGSDWGAKRNRSAHVFAHARLLSLIRYKAEKHGIAVVTTEESYTSKSSFVDNDELKVFKENKRENKAVEDGAAPEDQPQADVVYSGIRPTSNRNWFIRCNAGSGRLSKVHADVNGAFNIIRKVIKSFRYHAGLSLKFIVRWISPRRGAVSPLSCLSG